MSTQDKRQEIIKKVLGADDVEATMKAVLTTQGKAPQGAKMQIQFILACSQSKMVRNPAMPSLFDNIIRTQRDKVARFGEGAYPLSEKQIAVVARYFRQIVIKE